MPTCFLAVLVAYLHFFYSHGREEQETGGIQIIKKGVDRSKTKL